ncbi:GCR1-dependent translation factor 1 [Yarrowia sp. C11]|nr:GCR1-dependent translation factor 1 [Yarrowia sp. E02]KAG5373305.1 GCR1-dependent translation factor 1 [Yarrowia sp. C11]
MKLLSITSLLLLTLATATTANLEENDHAMKTAPKDYAARFGSEVDKSDKFVAPGGPDVEDHEREDDEGSEAVKVGKTAKPAKTVTDKQPTVINDYDPNNIGQSEAEVDIAKDAAERAKEDRVAAVVGVTEPANDATGSKSSSSSSSSSSSAGSSTTQSSSKTSTSKSVKDAPVDDDKWHTFVMAFSMIITSEIGDKTFLLAAIMASKHSHFTIFSAAFSSLALMTVLSAALGQAFLIFVSPKVVGIAAGVLFLVFGIRLLHEATQMEGVSIKDEMAEVESEIEASELNEKNRDLEEGTTSSSGETTLRRQNSAPGITDDGLGEQGYSFDIRKASKPTIKQSLADISSGFSNLASLVLSPAWVQIFVMTFLAEWGDRSQISTIAMGAGSNFWPVVFGGVIGHACCTSVAIIGGKLLAQRVSIQQITLVGAVAFIIYAMLYFWDIYSTWQ